MFIPRPEIEDAPEQGTRDAAEIMTATELNGSTALVVRYPMNALNVTKASLRAARAAIAPVLSAEQKTSQKSMIIVR